MEGGSANDYDYASGDPINNLDRDGSVMPVANRYDVRQGQDCRTVPVQHAFEVLVGSAMLRAVTHPNWAGRLAAAIEQELGAIRRPGETQVREIRATSPEEVEIVYTAPGESQLRGVRVSLDLIRSAPARISDSTIDELAFDIVTMGILEPRQRDEFEPADAKGVRWLVMSSWLAEIT